MVMASSALPCPGPDDGAAGSGAGAGTEDSASGSRLPVGAGVAGVAGGTEAETEAVGGVEGSPVGVPPPSFGVQAGNRTAANNNAAMRTYGWLLDRRGRGKTSKRVSCSMPPECTLCQCRGLSVMMPFYCRRPAGRLSLLGLGRGCDKPHHGRVQLADLASGQAQAFHHGARHLERLLPKGGSCGSEADGEGALVAVHPPS